MGMFPLGQSIEVTEAAPIRAPQPSLIKADANRQRCVSSEEGLPAKAASRAVDEYLAVLDAAFSVATPKFISPAGRDLDDARVYSTRTPSGERVLMGAAISASLGCFTCLPGVDRPTAHRR